MQTTENKPNPGDAPEFETLFEKYEGNCWPSMVADLAHQLGVKAESLVHQRLGFAPIYEQTKAKTGEKFDTYAQWMMPMRDASGKIVGLSNRDQRTGDKYTVYGSKLGFFYALNPDHPAAGNGYDAGPANWVRVADAGVLCPICEKPDRCIISSEDESDPKAVICIRVREGAVKPMKFGYLHIRKEEGKLNSKTGANLLIGDPDTEPVIVVEGYSDCAAATDLGLVAVGRPNALACLDTLREIVRGRHVIVIGENDRKPNGQWPGKEGMQRAADAIAIEGVTKSVTIVLPPKSRKDFRAWAVLDKLTLEVFSKWVKDQGQVLSLKPASVADKNSQTDRNLRHVLENVTPFHSPDGKEFVTITENGVSITRTVKDEQTTKWIRYSYYKNNNGKHLPDQAVRETQQTLSAIACFDGEEHPVYVRVGYDKTQNAIQYDLANDAGEIVKITSDGWQVTTDTGTMRPVRTTGKPQVAPQRGGSLDLLRPLMPSVGDDEWVLMMAWTHSMLLPNGSYPILSIQGPQGCGKSNYVKMFQSLIDPASLRTHIPATVRDLAIACNKSFLLSFDNISEIPPEISDALCSVSTGGGFVTRAMYTDGDEVSFEYRRLLQVGGIPEILTRADLRDRAMPVLLRPFKDTEKTSETELWAEFERIRPLLLGALFDAASVALRNLPSVTLTSQPRMLDFTKWTVAAEAAMPWESGVFERVYAASREEAQASAIESTAVGVAIELLMKHKAVWKGTATDLLAALADVGRNGISNRPDFPKFPRAASNALARLDAALRARGIATTRSRSNGANTIILTRTV